VNQIGLIEIECESIEIVQFDKLVNYKLILMWKKSWMWLYIGICCLKRYEAWDLIVT